MKDIFNSNLIGSNDYNFKDYNVLFKSLGKIFIEYSKSIIPIYSSIEKVIGDELKVCEENRINSIIKDVQDKVALLDEEKLDKNFINTEEFARMVFFLFKKAKVDYREDKLKYYANMLVNYCTVKFSDDFYKEGIIERVSKYSVEHILILNEAYKVYMHGDKSGVLPQGAFKGEDIIIDNLCKQHIELCILDLISNGDLREIIGFSYGSPINNNFKISPYGIKCIEIISDYTNKNI